LHPVGRYLQLYHDFSYFQVKAGSCSLLLVTETDS